jgi:pilus assembly protein Flp/PilA
MFATVQKALSRLRRDEEGATLVEYGIALGLAISLGAGALAVLADDVGASMEAAGDAMPAQATSPTN